LVEARATSRMVAVSISDRVIGIVHWQILRPHYGPGVDPVSDRNEYRELILRKL
jgi:hypothetical protein